MKKKLHIMKSLLLQRNLIFHRMSVLPSKRHSEYPYLDTLQFQLWGEYGVVPIYRKKTEYFRALQDLSFRMHNPKEKYTVFSNGLVLRDNIFYGRPYKNIPIVSFPNVDPESLLSYTTCRGIEARYLQILFRCSHRLEN